MARSDYDQAILDEITAISNSLERIAESEEQKLLNEKHSSLKQIAEEMPAIRATLMQIRDALESANMRNAV